jgi:MFS family permease
MDESPSPQLGQLTSGGRSAGRLVLDRKFGPYLAGKSLSLVGLWLHNLVAVVVGYEVTGSVTFVGLISLAQFGPQALFAGWSGSVADRRDRVRQIAVGRGLSLVASAAVGSWCLAGVDRPGTVPFLLGTSLLMGLGLVVGGPAMMALVPSLVRPQEIPAAVRLDSLPMLVGRTIGPALGALMLAGLGAGPAFLASAATNVVFIVVLFFIRPKRSPLPQGDSADRSMWAALRLVRRQPRLGLLILGVTAASFGADPSITLAPAIAERNALGAAAVGVYSAAFGLGAALGVLVLGVAARRFGTPRLVTWALVTLAVSNLVLAAPSYLAVAVVAFACGGAGMSIALAGCTTLIQLAVSDEFRGRVMSLWLIGFVGSRPVAALFNGVLADLVSVAAALVFVASVVAVAAAACRPAKIAPPGYLSPRERSR